MPTDFGGFPDEPSRIEAFDRMNSDEIQPGYHLMQQLNTGFGQSANGV